MLCECIHPSQPGAALKQSAVSGGVDGCSANRKCSGFPLSLSSMQSSEWTLLCRNSCQDFFTRQTNSSVRVICFLFLSKKRHLCYSSAAPCCVENRKYVLSACKTCTHLLFFYVCQFSELCYAQGWEQMLTEAEILSRIQINRTGFETLKLDLCFCVERTQTLRL